MTTRHSQTPIMHRVVERDGLLFIGGVTSGIADGGTSSMVEHTTSALDRLGQLLAQVGSDKSKVLSATVYITDMSLKPAMNEAWVKWFGAENLPSRATIGVADLGPGVLLEIVTVACR